MNNAMDIIDTTIKTDWPDWDNYSMKDYFIKIATLIPDQTKERVSPNKENLDSRYNTLSGVCYALVIDGKFVKQGKTDTTMAKRVQSYNCGKKSYREKGTCSVSNYKCLQSMLAIGKPIEVYAFFVPPIYFEAFGEKIEATVSPSKYIEGVLNEKVEHEFNGKLPWCVQK